MLGGPGGIPVYAGELLAALARLGGHQLVLWSGSRRARACVRALAPAGARIVEPGFAGRLIARLGLFAGANPLPIEAVTGPVDVFHGLNYLLPSHRGRAARVVSVHDLSLLSHPEWHPAIRAHLHRWPLRRTMREAHHVITDAEVVRAGVVERLGVPSERVTVVPLAPAPGFRPRTLEELRPVLDSHGLAAGQYLLFVGALEPRKNVGRLLDALDLLRRRGVDVPPLVLVGPPGWRNTEVRARIAAAPGRARLLGYLSREDVAALTAGAALFTLPSLEEGFGLPVLDAMACGTPVVTSRTGALGEVAAGAALLMDPTDVEDLAATLERALGDRQLRADLSLKGLARAAEFSWERTARETLRVYERALAAR